MGFKIQKIKSESSSKYSPILQALDKAAIGDQLIITPDEGEKFSPMSFRLSLRGVEYGCKIKEDAGVIRLTKMKKRKRKEKPQPEGSQ